MRIAYSLFQVTFQSAITKFVWNIPNYITKFGILIAWQLAKQNLQVAELSAEVPN